MPWTQWTVLLLVGTLTACSASPSTSLNATTSGAPPVAPPGPMIVGVKVDQPGTGYLDIGSYRYSGMDVSVANAVSHALVDPKPGGSAEPYFLPVSSRTRVPYLKEKVVRFFAATFTMDAKDPDRDFAAGPYLITTQGVMVAKDREAEISGTGLAGRTVCVVGRGSRSEQIVDDAKTQARLLSLDSYSACMAALTAKPPRVDAFSTDTAILYGYANHPENRDKVAIVSNLVLATDIKYGIAFRREDAELCRRAAEKLKALVRDDTWDQYFKDNLPLYAAAVPQYKTSVKPSERDIDDNSCGGRK